MSASFVPSPGGPPLVVAPSLLSKVPGSRVDPAADVTQTTSQPPEPLANAGTIHPLDKPPSTQQQAILAKIVRVGLQLSPDPAVVAELRQRHMIKPMQANMRLQMVLNTLGTIGQAAEPATSGSVRNNAEAAGSQASGLDKAKPGSVLDVSL